jgi:hypothetical protein
MLAIVACFWGGKNGVCRGAFYPQAGTRRGAVDGADLALVPAASAAKVPAVLADRCTNAPGYSDFRAALSAAERVDKRWLINEFIPVSELGLVDGMRLVRPCLRG